MRRHYGILLLTLAASTCITACNPPPVKPIAETAALTIECRTQGRVELVRNSSQLQCLERKATNGNKFEFLVPVQNDPAAYATGACVVLEARDDKTDCRKDSLLDNKAVRVNYDAQRKLHTFQLFRKSTGNRYELELEGYASKHGDDDRIEYLEYIDQVGAVQYFVYLVDKNASDQKQTKYYLVEAFRLNDTQACLEERPHKKLKPPANGNACVAANPFNLLGQDGGAGQIIIFETDTGGGYEPPP